MYSSQSTKEYPVVLHAYETRRKQAVIYTIFYDNYKQRASCPMRFSRWESERKKNTLEQCFFKRDLKSIFHSAFFLSTLEPIFFS